MKKVISLILVMCLIACFCFSASAQTADSDGYSPIETPNGLSADTGPQVRGDNPPETYSALPIQASARISRSVYTNYYFKTTTGELYTTFNGTIEDALGNISSSGSPVTIALYRTSDNALVESHMYASGIQW